MQVVVMTFARVLSVAMNVIAPFARPCQRLWRLASMTARIQCAPPASTQFDGPIHIVGKTGDGARKRAAITLGAHCRFGRDVLLETTGAGSIELGDHVRVNQGCVLVSYSGLRIGAHTLIGEYVSIRDADHGMAAGMPIQAQDHTSDPITVGEDVWIARGVVILKGVSIGDGAVIGANSVVTKDVPSMAIAAGAPARVLKMRSGDAPAIVEAAAALA